MSDVNIAQEILRQLGGRRFTTMTGAKDFMAVDGGVQFRIGRNPESVSHVRITLTDADLYDLAFLSVRKRPRTYAYDVKTRSEHRGIGVENLTELFESATGLRTSL